MGGFGHGTSAARASRGGNINYVKEKSLVNVVWRGASGADYTSTLYGFRSGAVLPAKSGVYIVCTPSRQQPNVWSAIYVGEAENLNDRLNTNLKNHPRYSCFVRAGATQVCLLDGGWRDYRLALEQDLRSGLDPPCNRR